MSQFDLSSWLSEGGVKSLKSVWRESYGRIGWVYAAVSAKADAIASVPLILYDEKGKVLVEEKTRTKNHPLFNFFNPPNPPEFLNISDLITAIVINVNLYGDVFLRPDVKGKGKTPETISLISPTRIKSILLDDKDPRSDLKGWIEFNNFGQVERTYLVDELIQFKYYNPYERYRGLAPLRSARLAVEQAFHQEAWNANFFQEGAKNPIAITTKRTLNKDQREEYEAQLRRDYSGLTGGQRALILDNDASITTLRESAKDVDFVNGKQLVTEEICSIFDVMPCMVGIFRYGNYANSAIQKKMFWENTGLQHLRNYRDIIQLNLINIYFPGCSCQWDYKAIEALRPDETKHAQAAKTYRDMGYEYNEIAEILGDPKLEKEEPKEKPTTPAPGANPDGTQPPNDTPYEDVMPNEAPNDTSSGNPRRSFVMEYSKAYEEAGITLYDEKVKAFVKSYFEVIENQVIDSINLYGESILDINSYTNQWIKEVGEIISPLVMFAGDSVISDLATYELYKIPKLTNTKDITKHNNLTETQLYIMSNVVEDVSKRSKSIPLTTLSQLDNRLRVLLLQNREKHEMVELTKKIMGKVKNGGASTISKTLSRQAFHAGRFNMFVNLGVTYHKWISPNEKARPSHKQENGNIVRVGELFPITRLLYPSNPEGRSFEFLGCNCLTYPVSLRH